MVDKGKKIAVGKDSTGKRKRGGLGDADKSRRKNEKPGVLQFFEDTADVDDYDASDDDDDDDLMEEDQDAQLNAKNELGKAHNLPFIPKEEEIDEEEFEKMMEERFKQGSRFVKYAEDDYETKRMVEKDYRMPSAKDPTVWKVKCMAGRERHSAFCLMQKFTDLKSLGTKLNIISAFTVEHVKGFIYIEADRQCDVIEACKGLFGIYSSRMAPVLKNDVFYLLTAQSKHTEVSVGTWACVKNGKYKGDLAQIVAVNNERKRATVKLIPRIDLQALAAKFGGGATIKKSASVAPRLISSSELEEFRPLIQYRRDRDTGLLFENLDGLMFKDGYLYKKVSMDSLSCWGIEPSEEQLLKFAPSENSESADVEWLSQLYGEQRKKQAVTVEKGGGKGEGSSSSSSVNFELYELVCFGRKDFGLIVGMEKDDTYKVLQEGSEGPIVVTVERRNLKNLTSDMKFTAFDHCMKTISVNDTVRVLEGSSKGKQGLVKQIYRGIVFLHDENETENGGYFCSKSQLCEKIKLFAEACNEKGGGSGDLGFEEFPSSPKSPLSPKKPWQTKEFNSDFKRGDKDGIFSVGQTLRIRVGPLKGYLCRVLAVRHSDVTVKLDSQQKVLTVRSEHLAEVRGKSFGMSTSEDPGSNSFKPFDLLGTEGGTGDWTNGAGKSAESDRWNAGGLSAETERSSWPSFPAAGNSLQSESSSWNLFGSGNNDPKKDVEDSAWGSKGTAKQNSSWGAAATEGQNDDCWNKAVAKNIDSDINVSGSWVKPVAADGNPTGSPNNASASWGKKKDADDNQDCRKKLDLWDKGKNIVGNSSWGDATAEKNLQDSWGKGEGAVEAGATVTWEMDKSAIDLNNESSGWNQQKFEEQKENVVSGDVWKKPIKSQDTKGTGSWGNTGGESSWGKQDGGKNSWGKQDGGSLQGKRDGGSSWGKRDGGSSWGKQDGGGSSWGKQDGGNWRGGSDGRDGSGRGSFDLNNESSGWNQQKFEEKKDNVVSGDGWNKPIKSQDGKGTGSWGNTGRESSWGKQDGGKNSWGKQDGGGSLWGKQDGGSSWGTQDGGGSSWGKQDGGNWRGGSDGRDGSGRGSFDLNNESSGWNQQKFEEKKDNVVSGDGWNKPIKSLDGKGTGSWGNTGGESSWGKQDGGKNSWGKQDGGGSSWGKQDGGSSHGKQDGGSSWGTQDGGGSLWGKQDGGKNSWGKQDGGGGSSWGKQDGGKNSWGKQDGGGYSWGKQDGGSSQGKQDGGSSWGKHDGGSSWGTQDGGGSSWGKYDGGSSWGTQQGRQDGGNWRGGSDGRDGSGRGSFRGRGRSDRGGYGGRGRSDRGGYGGRGGSGRGGFGGRDGSDRGFGGRGRGRRGQDDWGTKDNDGAGSWKQGGGDNSQGKSWQSGNTGASSQACGWSGQSSGWNQATGAKDVGGDNFVGGSQGNNWKSSDTSGGWNKGSDGSAQAGGWGNQGSGSGNAAGNHDQPKSWNHQSNAAGWGQSKDREEGSGGGQGATDSWSKGAGSSWGSAQSGGWGNQGSGSGKAPGNHDQPKSWNHQPNAAGWGQSKDREERIGGGQGATDSWVKATGSSRGSAQAGGWGNQGSGSGNASGDHDQPKSWNHQSNAAGRVQSKDGEEGNGGGQGATDSWGKAAGSSWGNGSSSGSGKGGW